MIPISNRFSSLLRFGSEIEWEEGSYIKARGSSNFRKRGRTLECEMVSSKLPLLETFDDPIFLHMKLSESSVKFNRL